MHTTQIVGADRIPHGRETCHFALMAHSPETKRLGGPAVHLAEAIFLGRRQRHVLAAIECRELAGSKMTMAVVDRVAASVSGDDQSVLPRAVEKRGQCVC